MKIKAESLAYWYLRLNGCLTIANFIVHSEWKREGVGTDADIVGIRFPHRKEMIRRPLVDDVWFSGWNRRLLVFAEVKTGMCALNGPWTNPKRENIRKVLAAMGVYPAAQLNDVAGALYTAGVHEDRDDVAALLAFGSSESLKLREHYPRVPQLLWPQVKRFIHGRFSDYLREKAWHQTWDTVGERLYELAKRERDVEHFCQVLEVIPER